MSAGGGDSRESGHAGGTRRPEGMLARALGEPLVHFLIAGVALFVAYGALQSERSQGDDARRIALTADDIRRLEIAWTARWQRPPAPAELKALIEAELRQEILYREALALGLGENDTIVKRRLAQKMEFLAEDLSTISDPSRAELRAWYEKHAGRFALAPRASFRHLYFSPDRLGAGAREDAGRSLAKVRGEPADSPVAAGFSDPFMFQGYYGDHSYDQLARVFGATFVQSLFGLEPGFWQGPIESGYGWHLVFVETIVPRRVPAFEEVERDVRTAWLAEQKALAWERVYGEMRAKYTVVLPALPEGGSSDARPQAAAAASLAKGSP